MDKTDPASTPETRLESRSATDYSFAGIRVGQRLGEVVKSGPFAQICDIEEVADDVSIVVYAGRNCDERNFDQEGTISLFVTGVIEDESMLPEQVVRSVVWFGDYFDSRAAFPGKAEMSRTQVDEALGPATHSCDIGEDEDQLHLQFHPGGTYSVLRKDTVIGYGAGEQMPETCQDEQWEILVDVYFELHTTEP